MVCILKITLLSVFVQFREFRITPLFILIIILNVRHILVIFRAPSKHEVYVETIDVQEPNKCSIDVSFIKMSTRE